jgi:glycerol-3-phosphate dehydrogenase
MEGPGAKSAIICVPMKRDIDGLSAREHDVVVIGGGIIGAAAAWDAAQRGLDVALVEAADFASGTSFNSLKTIHGGLRYLQSFDLPRMRQSIADRRALLRIAPGLVRPVPFVVPVYGHGTRGREAFGMGLRLNEWLSRSRNRGVSAERRIPNGRLLSRAQVLELMPGVEPAGLTGGALWYDAQVVDSERLVLAFLLQAVEQGAALANYVEVTGLLRDGPRVKGVLARDVASGADVEIRARTVLSAAGPWTENIFALACLERPAIPLLRSVNVVVRRPLLASHAFGARCDDRFVFMIPWRERTLVGTAYQPEGEGSIAESVDALLRDAGRAFPWAGLSAADLTLVHCGLVPGERGASGLWSRDLVRDHTRDGAPGLISIVGVKYTTARAVAQTAVDLLFRRLERASPPCRTAETPLIHARALAGGVAERARHAVENEMALHLSDVVLRRLDLGSRGAPPEEELAEVAERQASVLDWSDERIRSERRVLADRLELGLGGDAQGAAVRTTAGDERLGAGRGDRR